MSYNPNLEAFDRALSDGAITTERGSNYGHPRDDFARIAKLTAALPEFADPRMAHIARMIVVKLCRLSVLPSHLDSIIDIAGYARTWVMLLPEPGDERQEGRDSW